MNSSSSSNDWPPPLEAIRWERCRRSPDYFVRTYCHLYDAVAEAWRPFALWPAQAEGLATLHAQRQVCVLKSRQLGWSWLVVAYGLWQLLFRPGSTVLFFSRRDDEAVDLLDFRLRNMYQRLPAWLHTRGNKGAAHDWKLGNQSRAMAFPTTGGRSYTASMAVVDEADFVFDLNLLLNAVKPTIDAGGKLFLLSTADKSQPESTFKRVFRAARAGENDYAPLFFGWPARPDRTPEWYEQQKADVLARTGSLDDLYQEYPATEEEALSPRSLDRRIPYAWLSTCYRPVPPLGLPRGVPALPGLRVYIPPRPSLRCVLGADPAEGNPTSDPSACCLLDVDTGEEVASLAGQFEPSTFASYVAALADAYHQADLMVERNNHGAAVLLWLRDHAPHLQRLLGHDGKEGWMSSTKGKALLYGHAADALRDGQAVLHTQSTLYQLASVEGATLRAPEGQHDDEADAFALAAAARARPSTYLPPATAAAPVHAATALPSAPGRFTFGGGLGYPRGHGPL